VKLFGCECSILLPVACTAPCSHIQQIYRKAPYDWGYFPYSDRLDWKYEDAIPEPSYEPSYEPSDKPSDEPSEEPSHPVLGVMHPTVQQHPSMTFLHGQIGNPQIMTTVLQDRLALGVGQTHWHKRQDSKNRNSGFPV
jgi:hypothetical protein